MCRDLAKSIEVQTNLPDAASCHFVVGKLLEANPFLNPAGENDKNPDAFEVFLV